MFLNKKQLLDRGWSESLIKRFMPEPDKTKTNPAYRKAPPMKLYSTDRIAEIESTADFQQAQQKADARRLTGLLVAGRRRSVTLAKVEALPEPELPDWNREKLIARAVRNYNAIWENRGREDKFATVDADECFLQRITVNYIRHMLTEYERRLDALFGQVGKQDACIIVKNKVLQAIGNKYHWLAEECNRQMIQD